MELTFPVEFHKILGFTSKLSFPQFLLIIDVAGLSWSNRRCPQWFAGSCELSDRPPLIGAACKMGLCACSTHILFTSQIIRQSMHKNHGWAFWLMRYECLCRSACLLQLVSTAAYLKRYGELWNKLFSGISVEFSLRTSTLRFRCESHP